MCTCSINAFGRRVVCDLCARELIEARNTGAPGQVELSSGMLTSQEYAELTLAVTDFFAQLQSSVQAGGQE